MRHNRKALGLFLTVHSLLSLLLFSGLLAAFAVEAPALREGHGAFHWLIWDDVNGHVGPMLFLIYVVWCAFLLRAARDPRRHVSLLDFTMVANFAHVGLMVVQASREHLYHSKFLTDIPWLLLLAGALAFWRPAYAAGGSASSTPSVQT